MIRIIERRQTAAAGEAILELRLFRTTRAEVRVCQPLRQVTGMMVENIGERRDALTGHSLIDPRALEP